MPQLVALWDVDHTLISTEGVGAEILAEVFEQLTGRPLVHKADVTGKSELVILSETLALHEIPASSLPAEVYTEALVDAHLRRLAELRNRGHALPGAAAALDALSRIDGVRQTVATGNIRPIATLKLECFGLDHHVDFDIGGYGEDAPDRADMIRAALRRAQVPPHQAVIFDDTIAGVTAGLHTGVVAVAVATGRTPADELAAAGATHVLADLADTGAVTGIVRSLLAPRPLPK